MEKYLCDSWKNFLYVLITNISQGYWYFSQFQFPERKKEFWSEIDQKMLKKYPIQISKDQRYRRKKKGLANFRFFRLENQAVFLRTEGQYFCEDDEKWRKLEGKEALSVVVGSLTFEIKNINGKYSVKLSKASFREIKANIREKLEKKKLDYAIKIFNNLNGLPNYKFLFAQKQEIKKFLIQEAKKHMGGKVKTKKIREKLIIKRKIPLKIGNLFVA